MSSISLDHVVIDMPIYDGRHRSLKHAIIKAGVGGVIRGNAQGRTEVRALDTVTLRLQDGDRVGLIGHNGAGKTTLLRVMGGLIEPTQGSIAIDGTVCTLLGSGGFLDLDMTGAENINFAADLLGIPRARRTTLTEEVAQFTQLGAYLTMPVRSYSAGMSMRLSFALMTAQEPDILLLDEVFGTGDILFFANAAKRLEALKKSTRISVLASHSVDSIRRMCSTVLWLEHGQIRMYGPTQDVLAAYLAA